MRNTLMWYCYIRLALVEVRRSTMVQVETFINPRQYIQTVLVVQARLLPLRRRCPLEKKLKHETNKSLVHCSLQQLTTRSPREVREWNAVEVASKGKINILAHCRLKLPFKKEPQ